MKPVYNRTRCCRSLAGLLRVVAENVVTDRLTNYCKYKDGRKSKKTRQGLWRVINVTAGAI